MTFAKADFKPEEFEKWTQENTFKRLQRGNYLDKLQTVSKLTIQERDVTKRDAQLHSSYWKPEQDQIKRLDRNFVIVKPKVRERAPSKTFQNYKNFID